MKKKYFKNSNCHNIKLQEHQFVAKLIPTTLNCHDIYVVGYCGNNNNPIGFSQKLKINKMPFTKIWIHLIWTTKNRNNLIGNELKQKLLEHIKENAKIKNIYIDTINCVSDHVHTLISMKSEQSISKIAGLIKGESSHWVNDKKLSNLKFEWQEEYIAVSVSESILPKIRQYIKEQEKHHTKKSFMDEYKEFMEKYGFNKMDESIDKAD